MFRRLIRQTPKEEKEVPSSPSRATRRQLKSQEQEDAVRMLGETYRKSQKNFSRLQRDYKSIETTTEKLVKENRHLRKIVQIRDGALEAKNLRMLSPSGRERLQTPVRADGNSSLASIAEEEMIIPIRYGIGQQNPFDHVRTTQEADRADISFSNVPDSIKAEHVSMRMAEMELQLSLRDEEIEILQANMRNNKQNARNQRSLERLLRESESQQTLLRRRLDRMEVDYDSAMTLLSSCFENMRIMTDNHKLKEAERTAVFWEANRAMEEQRAAHLTSFKKMADELHCQQERVQELEAFADSGDEGSTGSHPEETGAAIIGLQQIVLDNSRSAGFAVMQMQHELDLEKNRQECERRVDKIQSESYKHMKNLNDELKERNDVISLLEEEMMNFVDKHRFIDDRDDVQADDFRRGTPADEAQLRHSVNISNSRDGGMLQIDEVVSACAEEVLFQLDETRIESDTSVITTPTRAKVKSIFTGRSQMSGVMSETGDVRVLCDQTIRTSQELPETTWTGTF